MAVHRYLHLPEAQNHPEKTQTLNKPSVYDDLNEHSVCVCVHLCSVEDIHDFGEDGATVALVFLTDQLDVSELAEVEISFFLQTVNSQLQVHQLHTDRIKHLAIFESGGHFGENTD